jgi:hypothetical protein
MSTETSPESPESGSERPARGGIIASRDQSANANWAVFFEEHGWIDHDKIHCPDELIFEMRFADGFSLVVYPATGGGESEIAPTITHGVLTFKNGTDHFYYPWSMLASLVTKLNPRRSKKVQGRDYVVDHERERRFNSDDVVIQPPVTETPKTVVGQTVAPPQPETTGGRRTFSQIDPLAPSWSAGGTETEE